MSYIIQNPGAVFTLLLQHLEMTVTALLISLVIAFPLSVLIVHYKRLNAIVAGTLGILYTIPSIALMILLLPIFGLDATTVVVALVIYTQMILVRNIVAALKGIDPHFLEAARGMGMNAWQVWWRVQLPLAAPVILAGVRLAALVSIAIATIGAMFGAGGLGKLLFDGIAENRYDEILAGAIAVAALAIVVNWLLQALERQVSVPARIARAERGRKAALDPEGPGDL